MSPEHLAVSESKEARAGHGGMPASPALWRQVR
jgi:hypothetical protein